MSGGLDSLFTVTGDAGRDGPGGTQTKLVALQLSDPGADGVPTSLYATEPGAGTQIYLFQNGAVIEGRAGTTSGSPLVFTISLTSADPATAQVTFTQYLPIEHGNTAEFDETAVLNTLGSDAVNLLLTTSLTDADGDTATSTATYGLVTSTSSPFSIDDDGPTVSGSTAGSGTVSGLALNLDETNGTDRYASNEAADVDVNDQAGVLPVGAIGSLTSSVSGGLSTLFIASGTAGRDGLLSAQTQTVTLQLSDPGADGVPTSLYATGPGVGTQIYLFQNGDVIEGRAGTTSGSPLVFTISLTSTDATTAQVTFTQYLPIEHGNTAEFDETAILNTLGSDAVNLVLNTTLTDQDGDTATVSATYGLVTSTSSPFSIDDDGPTVSASVNGSASTAGLALNLDETAGTDRYAAGDAADNNGGSDEVGLPAGAIGTLTSTVTGGLASLFTVSGSAGRDGVAGTQTTAVALQLSDPGANGVPTSLYATGPGVGTQIYLFQNGTVIEGRAGTTSGSPLVFTISLTSSDPATAQVTFTQYLPIEHGNTALYDEAAILNTLGSDAVNLVLTTSLTDGDGDTATTTATYGLVTSTSSPFSIDDDGPTVSASVNGSASTAGLALNLDETAGTDRYAAGDAADNNGGSDEVGLPAGAIGTLTSTVTGGLASLFTVSGSAGRDGVAGTQTTAVALQLSDPGANGVPTSLYATGPGVGTQIYLFQNGTVIEGRAGTTSGSPLVFTISLTSSDAATAQVTFTQYLPIEHGNTALYDEAAILNTLGSDAVNLVLTTSLTDGDGDTATTTATYGLVTSTSSPFSIDDDGPTVSASVNGSASTAGLALNLDETAGTDRYAAGDAADNNGGSRRGGASGWCDRHADLDGDGRPRLAVHGVGFCRPRRRGGHADHGGCTAAVRSGCERRSDVALCDGPGRRHADLPVPERHGDRRPGGNHERLAAGVHHQPDELRRRHSPGDIHPVPADRARQHCSLRRSRHPQHPGLRCRQPRADDLADRRRRRHRDHHRHLRPRHQHLVALLHRRRRADRVGFGEWFGQHGRPGTEP